MSHLRICLPCKVKFQTDKPAGLNYCDLELIALAAPESKKD